jgi:hypothetical protein
MMPGYRTATPQDCARPVSVAFPGELPRGGYSILREVDGRAHVQRRGAMGGAIVPWEWVLVRS